MKRGLSITDATPIQLLTNFESRINSIDFTNSTKKNKTMKQKLQAILKISFSQNKYGVLCLVFFATLVSLNACLDMNDQKVEEEDITMDEIRVTDPLIWNTLANQSISVEDIEKSASKSMKEYPGGDKYYYALFEDLYPGEGDYDFNDIVLKSKLYLSNDKDVINGRLETELVHRGGNIVNKIGLAMYDTNGKNKFKRIPNEDITVNDVQLSNTNSLPYTFEAGAAGNSWEINFTINSDNKRKDIWLSFFIITNSGEEILTAGFAKLDNYEEFELPERPYLTADNKPWGIEIEAKEMPIVVEKENFCKAFPDFVNWVNDDGNEKYKKWYEKPDENYIQATK